MRYKNIKVYLLVLLFYASCSHQKNVEKTCIPKLVIDSNSDTLNIGDLYKNKIYLTDSSIYYFEEYEGYVLPVVKINDSEVEVEDNFVVNYNFKIIDKDEYTSEYNVDFWDCDFTIATLEGEITISRRVKYIIHK